MGIGSFVQQHTDDVRMAFLSSEYQGCSSFELVRLKASIGIGTFVEQHADDVRTASFSSKHQGCIAFAFFRLKASIGICTLVQQHAYDVRMAFLSSEYQGCPAFEFFRLIASIGIGTFVEQYADDVHMASLSRIHQGCSSFEFFRLIASIDICSVSDGKKKFRVRTALTLSDHSVEYLLFFLRPWLDDNLFFFCQHPWKKVECIVGVSCDSDHDCAPEEPCQDMLRTFAGLVAKYGLRRRSNLLPVQNLGKRNPSGRSGFPNERLIRNRPGIAQPPQILVRERTFLPVIGMVDIEWHIKCTERDSKRYLSGFLPYMFPWGSPAKQHKTSRTMPPIGIMPINWSHPLLLVSCKRRAVRGIVKRHAGSMARTNRAPTRRKNSYARSDGMMLARPWQIILPTIRRHSHKKHAAIATQ